MLMLVKWFPQMESSRGNGFFRYELAVRLLIVAKRR